MIIIKTLSELLTNKQNFCKELKVTNYQQTYNNLLSIHLSNDTAITFLDLNMIATFIKKDDNIFECATNIEPIIFEQGIKEKFMNFIIEIQQYLNKTLYFPLVYDNSVFYKLLKDDLYNYKRLYTSITNHKQIGNDILKKVLSSERVFFSMRNVKIFEKNLYIKYYTKIDATLIIKEIEKESWKYKEKQDMLNKKEQLIYYSELIRLGLATIAVAYTKQTKELVSYRIDAIFNDKICVLKNSYKDKYKKYSPGSYMLIYDLFKKYPDIEYIDLYGGPGLAKEMIETSKINRYDMLYGNQEIINSLEESRKKWDMKNYENYLSGNSIKNVFEKKENILVATSCFGLGPVGKLNSIIQSAKDKFNWYATGEKFDLNIFDSKEIFKDTCFTLDKVVIKKFVDKYKIKYAIVVLKNRLAHILKELNIKVIYVDSLPFMWSDEDAKEGKIPYEVDCYCAQKTIELSSKSKKLFSKVKNLYWINPIININKIEEIKSISKKENYILMNLGGLHSPTTDGMDYVDVVVIPLLEIMKNEKIYITTSSLSKKVLIKYLKKYKNVTVITLEQEEFLKSIKKANLFITSPGLTTILESSYITNCAIFLPPQNISQFYNIEYAKKVFNYYKEITWNCEELSLEGLKCEINKDEKKVIEQINFRIRKMNNNSTIINYKKYLSSILNDNYSSNSSLQNKSFNGSKQVINLLSKLIKEENK